MQRVSPIIQSRNLQSYIYPLGAIRWAFVDFTTTEFATLALTNPRNHSLDGRALVVEYASPNAAQRSGSGRSRGPDEELGPKKAHKPRQSPKAKCLVEGPEKSEIEAAAANEGDENSPGEGAQKWHEAPPSTVSFRKHKPRLPPRSTSKAKRAKPGAALASAPRESGAIVASTGKKIIF